MRDQANAASQADHVRAAEKLQAESIRRETLGRRLEISLDFYETAWQLKEAGLRRQHPDWSEEDIQAKCRCVFITGYAGAQGNHQLGPRFGDVPDWQTARGFSGA